MGKRKKSRRSNRVTGRRKPNAPKPALKEGMKLLVAAVVTFSVLGAALAAFKHQYEIEHDLSVIGKGIPAVVQVHNPNCQLCSQLRRNASAAIEGFDGRLLFRVADITTRRGHRLQRRYDVEQVTLLLFDGRGELRNVLSGVRDEDSLQRAFTTHLNRWGD